jgi:hypothetical protein
MMLLATHHLLFSLLWVWVLGSWTLYHTPASVSYIHIYTSLPVSY